MCLRRENMNDRFYTARKRALSAEAVSPEGDNKKDTEGEV